MTLYLHTGPISSITPSGDYKKVLTSSWDGLLGVFALPTEENPLVKAHDVSPDPSSYLTGQDRRQKKRRLNNLPTNTADDGLAGPVAGENGLAGKDTGGWRKAPEMVLRGHTGRIGGSLWDKERDGMVWSAGWDGSVRGWDVDSGACEIVKVSVGRRGFVRLNGCGGGGALTSGWWGFRSKDLRNVRRFVLIRWLVLLEALSRVIWIGSYAYGTLGNVSRSRGKQSLLFFPRCRPLIRTTSTRARSHIGHLPQPAYSFSHSLRLRPSYLSLHPRHRFLLGSPSDLGHPIPETSLV